MTRPINTHERAVLTAYGTPGRDIPAVATITGYPAAYVTNVIVELAGVDRVTARTLAATGRTTAGHIATPKPAAVQKPFTAHDKLLLELVALGLDNAHIAARTHMAVATIRRYVNQLISRLGAAGRDDAVLIAIRLRIITTPTKASVR